MFSQMLTSLSTDIPGQPGVVILSLILILTYLLGHVPPPTVLLSGLPVVNRPKWYEIGYEKSKKRYVNDAAALIKAGLKKNPNAFWLFSDHRYRLVLSPKYATNIRSRDELNLGRFLCEELQGHVAGFEPLKYLSAKDKLIIDVVKMSLSKSQSLAKLIPGMSEESDVAFREIWTDNPVWHTVNLHPTLARIIARVSASSFLGDGICRDPAWETMSHQYSKQMFIAARELRSYPEFMRSTAARFLPSCRKLQSLLRQTEALLEPLIVKREAEWRASQREGKTEDLETNSLSCLYRVAAGRPFNPAYLLLSILFVAIDTTAETMHDIICDLSRHENVITELRREVIEVIGDKGLEKANLADLKLMDSVMKESQRLRPAGVASMHRIADSRVELEDGIIIPKDSSIMVSSVHQMDDTVWSNGTQFDPYRFLKLRDDPAQVSFSRFISMSPDQMGFGYGKQGCPGRFFASNVIKIMMCYILLKYDFKVSDTEEENYKRGHHITANTDLKVSIRRRTAEMDL